MCGTSHHSHALQLPGDIKLNYFDKENNMQEISVDDLTKGKKARSPEDLQIPSRHTCMHAAKNVWCQRNTHCP